MVANNTSWTPSSSPAESKGATPAQPPKDGKPAQPEKPFTGRPEGVKWEGEPAKKKAPPPPPQQDVAEDDAPEGMTAAEKKIWKIKVNGKERDFDASDETKVRQMIEKAFGADEAFQKASMTAKQAEQFFGMLKEASKDPRKLEQLLKHEQVGGADFKKLAEQYLWEQIQEEKMTPEQKEERRVREELQRYKEQEAKAKAEAEAKEQETLVGQIQQSFTDGIKTAHMEAGLNSNPQSIYRMAEYARDDIDQGREPNFKAIAARVKQDYIDDFIHYFENAEPEQLKAIASESFLKKLRKMDLDRLKSTTPEQFKASTRKASSAPQSQSGEKKLDGSDWRAKLLRERG